LIRSSIDSTPDLQVKASLGPRWTAAGPFKTLALGGGMERDRAFSTVLGLPDAKCLRELGQVDLDEPTRTRLRNSRQLLCADPVEDLIKARDEEQIAILKVQGKYHPGSVAPDDRPAVSAERIDK